MLYPRWFLNSSIEKLTLKRRNFLYWIFYCFETFGQNNMLILKIQNSNKLFKNKNDCLNIRIQKRFLNQREVNMKQANKITGAEIVIKALIDQGVDTVLGILGGRFCQFMMNYFSKKKLNTF